MNFLAGAPGDETIELLIQYGAYVNISKKLFKIIQIKEKLFFHFFKNLCYFLFM